MNRWNKREQHEKACAGVRAHRGLCCRFMAACLAFTLAAAPAAWAATATTQENTRSFVVTRLPMKQKTERRVRKVFDFPVRYSRPSL